MEEAIRQSIDDLNEDLLEQALVAFLAENKLSGEWLVWIEKWKSLRRVV